MAKRDSAKTALPKPDAKLVPATVFTKKQLLQSKRFETKKDLLDMLLAPNERVTMAEAEKRMKTFLAKEAR
ncbi:hypothetical protein [Gorillibacterium sp. CAU 1737]|uniref:hypothetical protein n=1 Tax=Gorillibacterium sp. CAU 1737 TaxID=3140362 RepID=UPI003261B2B1